ncbi:Dapper-like 3 [Manis pentadactyla]|nr:Dapper-like 3 [Manis pentadactyla]
MIRAFSFPEALPGLIWDLGQQLGDLSLESGGLEQRAGELVFYEDPSPQRSGLTTLDFLWGQRFLRIWSILGPLNPGIYASEEAQVLIGGGGAFSTKTAVDGGSEEGSLEAEKMVVFEGGVEGSVIGSVVVQRP